MEVRDSRCPLGTLCPLAGKATAIIEITPGALLRAWMPACLACGVLPCTHTHSPTRPDSAAALAFIRRPRHRTHPAPLPFIPPNPVLEGAEGPEVVELDLLDQEEIRDGYRLICQAIEPKPRADAPNPRYGDGRMDGRTESGICDHRMMMVVVVVVVKAADALA
jgi:hypothetical protein